MKAFRFPKWNSTSKVTLKITASPNSSPNDFDFLVGKWKMHNRHLNKRLADCHDWTEFDSSDVKERSSMAPPTSIPIPRPGFPDWRANFSKGSPCAFSIPRVSGVSTGSRAIRED